MESSYKAFVIVVVMSVLDLIGVFIIVSVATLAAESTATPTVPSPLEVEEFNRQHCQLEVDADNQVTVYCKGE